MSNYYVVIPARYSSSRLPGKPMETIGGKTMIHRVWEKAMAANIGKVIVATDAQIIVDEVERFGGTAMMTPRDCASGTERITWLANECGMAGDDVVINLQGDEPFVPVEVISKIFDIMVRGARMATLAHPIHDEGKLSDPAQVKVVINGQNKAMYFSRAAIPYARSEEDKASMLSHGRYYGHIGVYGYTVAALRYLQAYGSGVYESVEKLEQLSALEAGVPIEVGIVSEPNMKGIDTPDDLEKARSLYEGGAL